MDYLISQRQRQANEHDTLERMEKESQSLITMEAILRNPNPAQTLEQIPPDGSVYPIFPKLPEYIQNMKGRSHVYSSTLCFSVPRKGHSPTLSPSPFPFLPLRLPLAPLFL